MSGSRWGLTFAVLVVPASATVQINLGAHHTRSGARTHEVNANTVTLPQAPLVHFGYWATDGLLL